MSLEDHVTPQSLHHRARKCSRKIDGDIAKEHSHPECNPPDQTRDKMNIKINNNNYNNSWNKRGVHEDIKI